MDCCSHEGPSKGDAKFDIKKVADGVHVAVAAPAYKVNCKHRVDDATFKALWTRLGDDGLIQLTGAIGYYSMLSMTVNACELEAAPGAEVLQ